MRHALDLWSFEGRVSRAEYVLAGAALFAAKYGIDLLVSMRFHQPWNPLMYVSPTVSPLLLRSPFDPYWISLMVTALPFIAAGVSLSARRLRDMGISSFWAGLFFLPFFHFAFFAVLAAAPPRAPLGAPPPEGTPYREPPAAAVEAVTMRLLSRVIPRRPAVAFILGLLVSLLLGFICFIITKQVSLKLGGGLFVGVPFGMGFITALAVSYWRPVSSFAAVGYGWITIGVSLLLLMALKWEGVACLVMAAPLLGAVSALGSIFGRRVAQSPVRQTLAAFGFFLAPLLFGVDQVIPTTPPEIAVVSTVTIKAAPATVWKNVISFPTIASAPEPIFAIVSMPLEARIDGQGPGAVRRCIFTSGTFVEPIEVWRPGHELTFGVTAQPENLGRYIDVVRGQFLLTANADGSTTLRGTTWYRLHVFPTAYWSAWSQTFLHAIHLRVLKHIQSISEHPEAYAGGPATLPAWVSASHGTCRCTMPAPNLERR